MKKRKVYQPPRIDVIIFSRDVQENVCKEKNIQRKGSVQQTGKQIEIREAWSDDRHEQ